jgi:hypothetical protein
VLLYPLVDCLSFSVLENKRILVIGGSGRLSGSVWVCDNAVTVETERSPGPGFHGSDFLRLGASGA